MYLQYYTAYIISKLYIPFWGSNELIESVEESFKIYKIIFKIANKNK